MTFPAFDASAVLCFESWFAHGGISGALIFSKTRMRIVWNNALFLRMLWFLLWFLACVAGSFGEVWWPAAKPREEWSRDFDASFRGAAAGNQSPQKLPATQVMWFLVSIRESFWDVPFVSKVRHCISHMWNIIVKSSLSASGVATEVLNCERQVFAKKL